MARAIPDWARRRTRRGGGPANGIVGAPHARLWWTAAAARGTQLPHILCIAVRPSRAGADSAPLMTDLAEEYRNRAATFRRLADELKSADDRAALLAIAEEYEAEALRQRGAPAAARRR